VLTESWFIGGDVLLLLNFDDAVILKSLLGLDSWPELGAVHSTSCVLTSKDFENCSVCISRY